MYKTAAAAAVDFIYHIHIYGRNKNTMADCSKVVVTKYNNIIIITYSRYQYNNTL